MCFLSLDLHMLVSNWFQQQRRRLRNMPALLNITRVSSHLVASVASVSKGFASSAFAALYNNVLSLRLLFLMRMMFLHVCVCVIFLSSFLFHFHRFFSFLFLFYFLIVYKFSPPLPRFLIFSISSSRFTNDFVFISICAPIGGSIIDFCLSLLHQKKPNFFNFFQQTAVATAFATLKKGARGEQNEDT